MEDWTHKHRKDQPDSKIVTMWFVFTWDEYINLKQGLEVYVDGKEYKVINYGSFDTSDYKSIHTLPVRVDLKEV